MKSRKRKHKKPDFGKTPMPPDKLYDEPITVIVEGIEYKMNRITIRDISAVYGRIRDNRIKALQRNSQGMHPDITARALAHASCIDPTQEDFWNYSGTPAGIAYIMWRSLAPNHPGISEDEAMLLIEKESALKDILLGESGITAPEPTKDPDAEGENRDPLPVFGQGTESPSTGSTEQDG